MAHLDDDALALIAVGEPPDERAAAHLVACGHCAREVDSLATAARLGRQAMGAERLATPEPRVWTAIATELGIPAERPIAGRPRASGGRRRAVGTAVVAIVAAAAAVVGLVVLAPRPAGSTVEATATLRAFPAWPDAAGTAVLEREASGQRVLRIRLSRVDVRRGYAIELWLMDADASRLVSLGIVGGGGGEVEIPRRVDLSRFSTVDVSAEPPDGNPAHSGDSIVRGALRF